MGSMETPGRRSIAKNHKAEETQGWRKAMRTIESTWLGDTGNIVYDVGGLFYKKRYLLGGLCQQDHCTVRVNIPAAAQQNKLERLFSRFELSILGKTGSRKPETNQPVRRAGGRKDRCRLPNLGSASDKMAVRSPRLTDQLFDPFQPANRVKNGRDHAR